MTHQKEGLWPQNSCFEFWNVSGVSRYSVWRQPFIRETLNRLGFTQGMQMRVSRRALVRKTSHCGSGMHAHTRHTHTHTHAIHQQAHTHTHTHTSVHVRTHTHTHMHTPTHTHRHANAHAHKYWNTHTNLGQNAASPHVLYFYLLTLWVCFYLSFLMVFWRRIRGSVRVFVWLNTLLRMHAVLGMVCVWMCVCIFIYGRCWEVRI